MQEHEQVRNQRTHSLLSNIFYPLKGPKITNIRIDITSLSIKQPRHKIRPGKDLYSSGLTLFSKGGEYSLHIA